MKTFVSVVALGLLFTTVGYASTDVDAKVQQLKNAFEDIHQTQVTYFVEEDYTPYLSPEKKAKLEKGLAYYEGVLQRRLSGQSTAEDEKYRGWSEQDLRDNIDRYHQELDTSPVDSVYRFSKRGDNIRLDIHRLENEENSCIYFFDGSSGVLHLPHNSKTNVHPSFTKQWTKYRDFSLFGSGYFPFLNDTIHAISWDPESKILELSDRPGEETHVKYRFIMSQDFPQYWVRFEMKIDDFLNRVIECSDFQEYNGVKIPKVVVYNEMEAITNEDGTFSHNGLYPTLTMSLLDAKVNEECDFPDGFFELPLNDGSRVDILTRN